MAFLSTEGGRARRHGASVGLAATEAVLQEGDDSAIIFSTVREL